MKTRSMTIWAVTVLLLSLHARADRVLQEYSWDNDWIKVVNVSDQELTKTVLEIDRPPITKDPYALTGRVKYEGVEGTGYIEMWSHFGEHGAFFSRTLMDHGPMQGLSGSSDWREFHLPFYRGPDVPPPERLVINVVLPGLGTVYLSPLKLVEPGRDAAGAWFSERQAGLYGGSFGAVIGGLGALIGTLVSLGRARRFVAGLIHALILLGAAALLAGVWAVIAKQPYHVFYPLLLIGVLCTCLMAVFRVVVRKRYEQWELRRIQAMDV
jgi:uncharacterized membrane protein YphA (DoxX/SURF4 family)